MVLGVTVSGDFEYAIAVEAAGASGQDRAIVVPGADRMTIALADGAGGTGNGATAAQAVVDAIAGDPKGAGDAYSLLLELDETPARLGSGQTTAVIAVLAAERVFGSSVGDSGAWIMSGDQVKDLTAEQKRKPLVGSGCMPVRFEAPFADGASLLVASDGLLRYAKRDAIAHAVNQRDLGEAARALLNLVRLPSGHLQDDFSIVLCRRANLARSR